VIVVDGPVCLVAALVVCVAHVLYLRSWRRERRAHLVWWQSYDAEAQRRHEEFMQAIDSPDRVQVGWNLDGNRERGQA
jgi:hypothetical protein